MTRTNSKLAVEATRSTAYERSRPPVAMNRRAAAHTDLAAESQRVIAAVRALTRPGSDGSPVAPSAHTTTTEAT